MTNTEISRRLALTIGYRPQDVIVSGGAVLVRRDFDFEGKLVTYGWRLFDHTEKAVIYPIAEHYKMFPQWNTQYNQWTIAKVAPRGSMPSIVLNDCPATCIALAVIEASERGLLS